MTNLFALLLGNPRATTTILSRYSFRVLAACFAIGVFASQVTAQHAIDFAKDIQPILRARCYACHAQEITEGGLQLDTRERALQGGDHGVVIVPRESAASRLIHRVTASDDDKAMPPEGKRLTADEIDTLRQWIDAGAPWPDELATNDRDDARLAEARNHWAFRPLQRMPLPTIAPSASMRNPIDRWVQASLESHGLTAASRADARTVIRRLSFDLIGLPPTPRDIEAFEAAHARNADRAVEDLVDRLLLSPDYGERWGRHWLDVARYADSDGQESDRDRLHAYPYRDFVIRALNDDMPFDQFVQWQLAGDEFAPEDPEAIAATGFLIAGPFAALPDRLMEDERLRNRFNELDDIVSTIGSGLLGLTLGCARCHDHKYDAIPARDYYRMLCALQSGERAERTVRGNSAARDHDTQVLAFQEHDAIPEPAWLFRRGNYYDREIPLQLGFITLMTRGRSPETYWQEARATNVSPQTTNQRRAMAMWMTDFDEGAGPLVARVFVNRLWQHHFGYGLVRTPGDFGVRADAPSHPELLDWLALDFVTHGWRVKRLQRMIVLSHTYLQSATPVAARGAEADPENRWLSHMNLQRLEGEVVRDAMLSVSGTLSRVAYGPAIKVPIAAEAIVARNLKDAYPDNLVDGPAVRRRSVYLFHKRVVPDPLQQAFDKPDAQQSCSRRDRTTVAPQALALLNDRFVRTVAADFARRVLSETDSIPDAIDRAIKLSLARTPTEQERRDAFAFVDAQRNQRRMRDGTSSEQEISLRAMADFCQVLLVSMNLCTSIEVSDEASAQRARPSDETSQPPSVESA